ncbi:hypothetical protein QC762_119470 [Podospora pseudocomata]|uniref:Uncharacterized protein n=1 Tax=Podospora pseudocomata TaxID=2093779 RepID=A0ABR0GXW1_9PEZI|nr:hypothetical protein QC762_119470 [Podospora pseudocomata]
MRRILTPWTTPTLGVDAWQPFAIHPYAIPGPKMPDYIGSPGGDHADFNQSSNAIQDKLGGTGNIVNITAAEIAVIVITVTLVLLALVGVFYCRILQARRDLDIENKAKERAAGPALGDAIELVHTKRASGSSCDTISIKNRDEIGEPSSSKGKTPAAMESNQEPKLPLRHYIHWKNPDPKGQTKQQEEGSCSSHPPY